MTLPAYIVTDRSDGEQYVCPRDSDSLRFLLTELFAADILASGPDDSRRLLRAIDAVADGQDPDGGHAAWLAVTVITSNTIGE